MARLSDDEIEERRAGLEGWERSGDAIVKQVRNGDFKGSIRVRETGSPGGRGR